MAQNKQTKETRTPTHRVTFSRKKKTGYTDEVEVSGAWENKAGGISFSFGAGRLTVWPIRKPEDTQEEGA